MQIAFIKRDGDNKYRRILKMLIFANRGIEVF